jgi:zinc/manganese transport system substrate-binding protein
VGGVAWIDNGKHSHYRFAQACPDVERNRTLSGRAKIAMLRRSIAVATGVFFLAAACATGPPHSSSGAGGRLIVVAAENFWGSIAHQVGGEDVDVTSIISDPNADPHDYEPTADDAKLFAAADLVLVNGIGYDPWAQKLLDANPVGGRIELNVGELVGEPVGGNPHQWYNPGSVRTVIDAIARAYETLSPSDRGTFAAQARRLLSYDLNSYFRLISEIRSTYADTKVGASESIFAELAPALGLDLVTPYPFLKAISEGTDPTAADKATIDRQISSHEIRIYVYNSQNATPDVQRQISACKAAGIPVTAITETLVPVGATFQQWQVGELAGIQSALNRASGS